MVTKGDVGGIDCLLDEAPEDPPLRKAKCVIITVIPANVHQPDQSDLPVIDNRKHASEPPAVDLFVVLLMIPSCQLSLSADSLVARDSNGWARTAIDKSAGRAAINESSG
jgi:hypothetical protein